MSGTLKNENTEETQETQEVKGSFNQINSFMFSFGYRYSSDWVFALSYRSIGDSDSLFKVSAELDFFKQSNNLKTFLLAGVGFLNSFDKTLKEAFGTPFDLGLGVKWFSTNKFVIIPTIKYTFFKLDGNGEDFSTGELIPITGKVNWYSFGLNVRYYF